MRQLGRRTIDVDKLYALLAENLASADDRKGFLATRTRLRAAPASKPGTMRATEPGMTYVSRISAPLTPEAIAVAQQKLAGYLGPIARVIVKKAATQAKTSRQFYMLLADHLASTAERERFLAEVGVV